MTELVAAIDITGKNVLIIGYPATGKTTITDLLDTSGHTVFHTDNYLQWGGIQSLLFEIQSSFLPTVVEGVMGYQLLRDGAENGVYKPDMIIELQRDFSKIERTYYRERKSKSMFGVMTMIKGCDTMLREYKNNYYNKSDVEWHIINIES